MPSVFTIKGPVVTDPDACAVIPGDDRRVRKAAKHVQAICKNMQRKLAPLGVGVVLGGSFRSGLAIPPRPGEPWDVDLRFLYDGDRAKMAKKIERLTGLTHRKTLNVVHGKKPVDLRLIEGTVTRNGATFEIEGALRDSEYFGIQALYPKLLTPAELRHARKQKLALRDDYPAYKAFKNNLLETVRRRAKAQGMLPSHLAGARQRKMVGRFCERTKTPKSQFDPRSFRYKKSGSSWILIGCPKGQWQPRKQRCKVGTRAHKILRNVCPTCRCKKGEKQKTKGR